MTTWQQSIILLYGISNFLIFIKGYYEITKKKNAFGTTDYLGFLGIFVWGDSFVLGPFWMTICLLTLFLHDWLLFLLILTIFWSVRSGGEVIYWLHEQFTHKNRNMPHTLKLYKLFRNDSVWFIYQLFWQCVLVISIITTLYLATLWIETI